jgi:hypothetical protein
MDRRVFPRRQIFIDDLTDKIGWAGFSLTHFTIPQCKALHITAYVPTSHARKQPFVSRKNAGRRTRFVQCTIAGQAQIKKSGKRQLSSRRNQGERRHDA